MEEKALKVSESQLKLVREKYLGQEIVSVLTAPTPKEWIKMRPIRGGGNVRYVAGPRFIERANDCFSFLWSFEVPEVLKTDNGQLVGKGELTIHVPMPKRQTVRTFLEDGKEVREVTTEYEKWDIKKTQWGGVDIKTYADDRPAKDRKGNPVYEGSGESKHVVYEHRRGQVIDLGDDYKSVSTEAFKKCCVQFGMFLDIYGGGDDIGNNEDEGSSDAQLDVVYFRGSNAGMTKEQVDIWAEKELGKSLSKAEPAEALSLVPKLIEMAKNKLG